MKILVFSDSHHTMKYMREAIEQEKPDHVIHLGDHCADAEQLRREYPMLPLLSVKGNCDYDPTERELAVVELNGFRFIVAHGHRYGVKHGLLSFELAAREAAADVALFGHTHYSFCDHYNGLWILNPGCCGSCSKTSYGIIEILNGNLSCRLVYLNERRNSYDFGS